MRMRIRHIISFFHLAISFVILLVKLVWVLLVLEWSIWRAERKFKEQIIMYGVPKGLAKRISTVYRHVMRRNVRDIFKCSIGGSS